MVRSCLVIVSDDQAQIGRAQSFASSQGLTVTVLTPEQWDKMNRPTEVPALVVGSQQNTEGGKILPFPGQGGFHNVVTGGGADPRKGVATINQLESQAIENAIAAFKGNLTEAAKALGIGRATLYRKVKQYNIDPSAARKKKAA